MHLTHRPVEQDDLPRCLDLLQEDCSLGNIDRSLIPKLWTDLRASGGIIMSVIEDQERPDQQIVGMGVSVFVTDQFMREAKSTRPPDLSAQIIREAATHSGPVLNGAAVRKANSGEGLNLFILHYGWDQVSLPPDAARAVRDELIRAFLNEHRGFHLKEILLQRCGEEAIRRVLTGGFLLRHDFEDYYRANGPAPPDDQRPYLAGMTREEAQSAEGSVVATLFLYAPPRLRLRPGEQDLLRRALLGETDEELALSLAISTSAVKKRWASIFERSAAAMPDLLPRGTQQTSADRKRGAEKRRRLLAYLRHHPEDLRPISTGERQSRNGTKDTR